MNKEDTEAILLNSLEFFFHRHYGRLCLFAKSILNDASKAEDVVQDLFARLCEEENLHLVHTKNFKGYLYTAVRNACISSLRHEKVVETYFQKNRFGELEEPSFVKNIIHSEVMGELHEALNGLPEGCATILKKAALEGMSNQEIADALQISINTVKSQKRRGIALLKERLNPDSHILWMLLLLLWRDF